VLRLIQEDVIVGRPVMVKAGLTGIVARESDRIVDAAVPGQVYNGIGPCKPMV
jgi:hypothetical protein